MRRGFAIVVVVALAVVVAAEAPQQSTARGIIVESVKHGSAADRAGLRVGDEILSWTRTVASSSMPIAQGDFRSPFDSREFELEQLPRGGTSITWIHGGQRVEAVLIPGYWGIATRPAFSSADLNAFEAGRALERDHPTDALDKWQPLIDRAASRGDATTVAWLLTRVASTLVIAKRHDEAEALFERAAALCREPADISCEATIWETKGQAHFPSEKDSSLTAQEQQMERRDYELALEANERARALRARAGSRTLAEAGSQVILGYLRTRGLAQSYSNGRSPLPVTSTEQRADFLRNGGLLKTGTATLGELAPGSFAYGQALARYGGFLYYEKITAAAVPDRREADAIYEKYLREARPILEAVAPTHIAFFNTLNILVGQILTPNPERGDEALATARRAVAVATDMGEPALRSAATETLVQLLRRRGATAEAVSVLEDAVRTGGPPSLVETLANLYRMLGDFPAAERVLLSRLNDGQGPPLQQARLWNALGNTAMQRDDLTTAGTALTRGLELLDQAARAARDGRFDDFAGESPAFRSALAAMLAPETNPEIRLDVARGFLGESWYCEQLSLLAFDQGNTERARVLMQRAVTLDTLQVQRNPPARIHTDWPRRQGWLAFIDRDFRAAEGFFAEEHRLTLQVPLSRGNVDEADALQRLALARRNLQDFSGAASAYREVLAIRRRFQPQSQFLAQTLHDLGHMLMNAGDRSGARASFEEALQVLDDYHGRVKSSPLTSSDTNDSVASVAVDVIGMLVEDGDPARAFEVLEHSRGRALLDLLATRDLRDPVATPRSLRDEQARLAAEYDQIQARISRLAPTREAQTMNAELARLHEIRLRQDELDRRVASLDPRAAALKHPVSLTLAEVRSRLDPGTALLSYSIGANVTYLFVVLPSSDGATGNGVSVHTIPMGSAGLRQSVDAFRTLIDWDTNPATADRAAIVTRGRALYDLLIRPAEAQIGNAQRLLLSPDGPLHALPFAALVRQRPAGQQYLIEWKPLHVTPSMSTYAEVLRSRRPRDASATVVAFGDAVYPPAVAESADAEVQFLARRGLTLSPLPATRREVGAIAQLFGNRAVTYLGALATEARAKAIGRNTAIIHFAVHGVFNDELPLDSALAFTMPKSPGAGEDNGLLQVWEIFEQMRIDADLVTLSACESGLGKAIQGEGLLGLTRAFIYAGARTVNASLWRVADGPTAELMQRFYANLRAGQSKDQALRNAQLAFIHTGRQSATAIDRASPAHWAGFVLTGDWK